MSRFELYDLPDEFHRYELKREKRERKKYRKLKKYLLRELNRHMYQLGREEQEEVVHQIIKLRKTMRDGETPLLFSDMELDNFQTFDELLENTSIIINRIFSDEFQYRCLEEGEEENGHWFRYFYVEQKRLKNDSDYD